jgi:predicted nucleic acid-binding Zn ribbon protein
MKKQYRREKLSTLGELISASPKLKFLGLVDEKRSLEIYQVWPVAAGPEAAANTRPLRLKRDTLHVAVRSAAWLQELTMLKPTLLSNLTKALGDQAPADIRFTLADFEIKL